MNINSFFAFLALIAYVITLIPSNLSKVFPHIKQWAITRYLLKHRRLFGLTAFSLSLDHVIISLAKYHINLLDIKTYTTYYTGISIFVIFTILAFTSNIWSIRKLKNKWKLLHQLTYIAMFLLLWHINSLMNISWTILTPIGLNCLSLAALIYISRLMMSGVEIIRKKIYSPPELPQLLSTKAENTDQNRQKIEVS